MFAVRHPLLSVPRRGLVVRFISSKTTAPAQAASLSTIDALSPREGLPRWPNLTSPTGCLRSLDWFGTAVFAVSGSLTAVTSGCDLFGSVLVGTITATGGGTLRDALVLNKSPFWVEEWEYLVLSAAAAAGTFYLWGQLSPGKEIIEGSGMTLKSADGGEGTLLDWGDAIGIGAFAVIGAMNGIRAQCPLLVSSICGMMTATFGAMRGIAPRLQGIRIASCVALGVAMRQQASTHGWRFPHWDLKGSQSVVYSSVDPRIQES